MNAKGKREILADFPFYLDEYARLEREYYTIPRIPIYHFIKQSINLHRRGKLNKWYQEKMHSWGL